MREIKQEIIQEMLLKYTAPLIKYDGFTAWTIAEIILDALEKAEQEHYDNDVANEERAMNLTENQ